MEYIDFVNVVKMLINGMTLFMFVLVVLTVIAIRNQFGVYMLFGAIWIGAIAFLILTNKITKKQLDTPEDELEVK